MKREFYSVKEVADKLGRHVNTVMAYITEGKLSAFNPNGPGSSGLLIPVESYEKFKKKYMLKKTDMEELKKDVKERKVKTRSRRKGPGFAQNY